MIKMTKNDLQAKVIIPLSIDLTNLIRLVIEICKSCSMKKLKK